LEIDKLRAAVDLKLGTITVNDAASTACSTVVVSKQPEDVAEEVEEEHLVVTVQSIQFNYIG